MLNPVPAIERGKKYFLPKTRYSVSEDTITEYHIDMSFNPIERFIDTNPVVVHD